MTEISFYQLQKSHFEEALPRLLEKTLELGKRAIVKVNSSAYLRQLDEHLWNHQKVSWLPHGSEKDELSKYQPIWLTTIDENPIGATFLFLADGAYRSDVDGFERCFKLFDGNNKDQLSRARVLWKSYRNNGHIVKFLRQNERGDWEEENVSWTSYPKI